LDKVLGGNTMQASVLQSKLCQLMTSMLHHCGICDLAAKQQPRPVTVLPAQLCHVGKFLQAFEVDVQA
jgi:hypothetical protein